MQKQIFILGLCVLALAGCATSTMYVHYTQQRFPPKDKSFIVNVYPESQPLGAASPYYVIGKVTVEGFASNGVNPDSLSRQAKEIARQKGADAIINAKTEVYRYYYGDELLKLKGELIVYAPPASK